MNTDTLLIQLGIAGAVLLVGYRIAILLIKNWRESESERVKVYANAEQERTMAISHGFAVLTGKIDNHQTTDIQSHQEMATGIARLDSKLDVLAEFTPVQAPPPQPPRARTPPQGIPTIGRPKTSGR